MEVLKTTAVSEKAAAKLLKKFLDNKEDGKDTDLMMNEEVKFQLAQVLAHLEGKKPQIQLQQEGDLYSLYNV